MEARATAVPVPGPALGLLTSGSLCLGCLSYWNMPSQLHTESSSRLPPFLSSFFSFFSFTHSFSFLFLCPLWPIRSFIQLHIWASTHPLFMHSTSARQEGCKRGSDSLEFQEHMVPWERQKRTGRVCSLMGRFWYGKSLQAPYIKSGMRFKTVTAEH